MNNPSRLLLPLAITLLALQGCGNMERKSTATETQAPVNAETATPVPVQTASSSAVTTPATSSGATITSPAAAPAVKSSGSKPRVDRYTVVFGDNLSLIAARPEVYGDERMWPLLYRANAHQIGPGGLIYPNQVLMIDRSPAQSGMMAPGLRPMTPAVPANTNAKPAPVRNTARALPEPADYLDGAREAFAAGDTAWAIHYYTTYLERKKNDVDVWGELGNVYYLEDDFAKAAKAYFNAANLLIDRGQTAYAMELMPVIEEADPSLAAALYKRLTTIRK